MNRHVRKKLNAKMEKELAGVDECSSICQLPNNILVDILSRLPIKSVIRCRCVCKSFFSTISLDPEFPPLHLSRSPPELILSPITELIFLIDYDNNRYHKLDLLRLDRFYSLVVLNSCRGLLCFDATRSSTLLVLNPVTHEYIFIKPPMDLMNKYKPHIVRYGFGYSPMTNKYKAIVIFSRINSDNTTNILTAICTLGPLSWRRIEDAPVVVFKRSFPVYLNGNLYLLVKKNFTYCIISFDFDHERFGEIEMPPPYKALQEKRFKISYANLVVFEGWLSVCLLMDRNRFDIWVMKERGANKYWYKEIAVETPNHFWSSCVFPLKYVNINDKKEVILGSTRNQALVTYDIIKKKIVKWNKLPFYNGKMKPLMHVPILVPLKDLIIGAEIHLLTAERCKWRKLNKNRFLNLARTSFGLKRISDSDADSDNYHPDSDSNVDSDVDDDDDSDYDVDIDDDSDYDDDSG